MSLFTILISTYLHRLFTIQLFSHFIIYHFIGAFSNTTLYSSPVHGLTPCLRRYLTCINEFLVPSYEPPQDTKILLISIYDFLWCSFSTLMIAENRRKYSLFMPYFICYIKYVGDGIPFFFYAFFTTWMPMIIMAAPKTVTVNPTNSTP